MKPTRGSVLAGLFFVAMAAPVAAYAVAADDPEVSEAATTQHPAKPHPSTATEPDHTTGPEHAAEASAPGRAHADAMKAWAHCVGEAASGPKAEGAPTPPKEACGEKPIAPGRAKHAPDDEVAPGRSGDHRPAPRGHGHGHR